ncbi:hypothetical protein BN136_33 [Cronobacter universalis NCTC 9529]|nr:hypothetical protein BN136_33 [Cronobacter universalis NCTC 9529]
MPGGVMIKMVFDIADRAFLDNLAACLIQRRDDAGFAHSG